MDANQSSEASKKILTIPNFLSLIRFLLAGVFAYVYLTAESQKDYYTAVGVLALSGVTDFADGKIARHFHMISELGKVLDPIADKLTQAVVAFCLAQHYPPMMLLFLVLVVKELCQGAFGAYAVKKAGHNDGAMWCGKISTFYLYTMMICLLLFPMLPVPVTNVLIMIGVCLLVWSFVSYLILFRKMVKNAPKTEE